MITYSRSPGAMPMLSFASNTEDVLIDRVFRKKEGFFIDVGASHPINYSVTKYLNILGWRGINIEPDSEMFLALVRDRPNDINLSCAVGRAKGVVTFYRHPIPMMSTTSAAHLDILGKDARSASIPVEVPMRSLADIVTEFVDGEVDLLKIDVEGSELDVIAGADWRVFRPRLLVIEATKPWSSVPAWQEWEPILLAHDYQVAFFDGINRYYLREEDRALMEQFAIPINQLDCYKTFREHQLETRNRALEEELEALKAGRVPG